MHTGVMNTGVTNTGVMNTGGSSSVLLLAFYLVRQGRYVEPLFCIFFILSNARSDMVVYCILPLDGRF